jgi:hypothetical protein
MTEQRGREYRLTVGDVLIESADNVDPLRVAFSVERDKTSTPNNAQIAIFNLAPSTRERIAALPLVPVQLEAGYRDSIGRIFLGALRSVRVDHTPPDVALIVSGGDGEDKLQTAVVKKSFARGTKLVDVLLQLVKATKLGVGNSKKIVPSFTNGGDTLAHGITFDGGAFDELSAFLRSCGYDWSCQSGDVQITQIDGTVPGSGPLLSADTGLIGTPELTQEIENGVTKKRVVGKCLLVPYLRPGIAAKIRSEKIDATIKILKTKHYGDTHGQEWYVDFEGEPL